MKKYNGYVDSVKAEFAERVFSSRKRVIKFVVICFVPFLYAFICIWAFWNPIPKIGEAPMALVSNDVKVNFIIGRSNNKIAAGVAYGIKNGNGVDPVGSDFNVNDLDNGTQIVTTAGTIITKDDYTIGNKTSLVDNLADSWKTGKVEGINYNAKTNKFTVRVNGSMTLTNLKFLNGADAKAIAEQKSDGSWNVKDEKQYWAQLQLPTNLTDNLIGFLDASLQAAFGLVTEDNWIKAPNEFLNGLKQNSIQFWSTYKHNFLFGQFMYIFDKFKSSLLVDIGPQVISDLISLLIQNSINNLENQISFIPTETVTEDYSISDFGSPTPHIVHLSFIAGQRYVVRNKEISDAIQERHSNWSMPIMSIEGTTGIDSVADWGIDGFLSVIAKHWNNLMSGIKGDLIANSLASNLTQKINRELPSNLGTLMIDSAGVKKLFSTAGNIAGLLEQDGTIIPNTNANGANFPISAKGSISDVITNYKTLITYSSDILRTKFNLISILSADSNSSNSEYVLPFGTLINPTVGTFNYNIQHDIKALIHLVLGQGTSQSVSSQTLAGFLPNINDFLKTTIVGSQFNPYGIGLGQFFLCIGLWVGTITQTFVFDRAKRVKKAKPWAWYLSKTTLMLTTAWLQTTVLMISVYALGWSVIGPAFGLMYLWMMFTATVFVLIQQALWFSVQDETVGKFLIILLLIVNLSAGWGTFPTFMQAPFFNFLSYFAPYTYSIHGQSVIIYSIAVNGANVVDTLYIMQQFGILILWGVVFLALGCRSSYRRNRDILYGSHNRKKLGTILFENDLGKYIDHKTKKVKWEKLPNEELPDIRTKVKKRYPEEGQYQWYKRWKAKNHPEKPLTASKSDDEIMSRND